MSAPFDPAHQQASTVCLPPGEWKTVLDCLCEHFKAIDREQWLDRFARGRVLDAEGRAIGADLPYRRGMRLHYFREVANEKPIPVHESIVHMDEHLVIADKPHFLPVTPGGRYVQQSLLVRLKNRLGIESLSPIHRIDRETAGLVLFSLRPQDRAAYQALFRERSVHKVYEAIASSGTTHAWPLVRRSRIVEEDQAFFRMGEADGEPNSETHMDRLETRGAWARYRLEPVTGKRHQLRVHMNALGLPIAGDQFYPRVLRGPDDPEDFSNPLRLLAQGIAFTDPVTGEHRRFGSKRVLAWPA